ncbi:MAG TPA: hypothetical protein VHM25_27845 [Polyangiaceae bacterium]|jgi:hypothetical protein|nr:hypothetical protein [Polyangiaceae bacterium]
MKRPKQRRAGATETFSVSVDPATKGALRALAKAEYGGNMSALVTALAEEARRRTSAGAYLRRHALPTLDQAEVTAIEAELEREIAALRQPRKRRRLA